MNSSLSMSDNKLYSNCFDIHVSTNPELVLLSYVRSEPNICKQTPIIHHWQIIVLSLGIYCMHNIIIIKIFVLQPLYNGVLYTDNAIQVRVLTN